MAPLPVVVAFVSQKGGVGKSTLARALATFATRIGFASIIADLDPQQRTVTSWELARSRHGIKLPVIVVPVEAWREALKRGRETNLIIVDTPGRVSDDTHALEPIPYSSWRDTAAPAL